MRLYLNTLGPIVVHELQSALGYGYAYERDHRMVTDPWDYAFGDARRLESEDTFNLERDRIIHVLLAQVLGAWEADFLYHPPGQGSALYHWSSTEGKLLPYRTVAE